jgi:hypothetical protein
VVASRNDTTCLRVPQASLRLADSVLVMIPNEHRALHARIMHRLDACPAEAPEPTLAYFRVSVPGFEPGELGVAVLDTMVSPLQPIRTDVDRNLAPDTYRACTSSEGVHLTVWSGEALRTDRLWHYYYYLGYDVEPNCVEAEYAEVPAASTGR